MAKGAGLTTQEASGKRRGFSFEAYDTKGGSASTEIFPPLAPPYQAGLSLWPRR